MRVKNVGLWTDLGRSDEEVGVLLDVWLDSTIQAQLRGHTEMISFFAAFPVV